MGSSLFSGRKLQSRHGRVLGRLVSAALLATGCAQLLSIDEAREQGGCEADAQCAPGFACFLGTCRNGCSSDEECGDGSRCLRALTGTACIPASEGCANGCPEGTRCIDGQGCRTPCSSASECAGGQACRALVSDEVAGLCIGTDDAHETPTAGGASNTGGAVAAGGSPEPTSSAGGNSMTGGAGGEGATNGGGTGETSGGTAAAGSAGTTSGRGGSGGTPAVTPGPGLGMGCDAEGAAKCAGVAKRETLVCEGGVWAEGTRCGTNQNCSNGTNACAAVVPECPLHADGTAFCTADDTVMICGADLVTAETEPCAGKCVVLSAGAACAPATCGDGKIQSPEECDDENDDDTDACTNACLDAKCGDGSTWKDHEVCDDGNDITSDACVLCKAAVCGDGFVREGTEACDDKNQINSDGCSNACRLNNGGTCSSNDDCVNTCVAQSCVNKPALNGSCDDADDCVNTAAPGCTAGLCSCPKDTCGSACVDTTTDPENCGACGHSCLGGECASSKCKPIAVVTGQQGPIRLAVSGQGIFWTNNGGSGAVMKAGLDGSGVATLALDVQPYGIAVDAQYVYYSAHLPQGAEGSIKRVPIVGGAASTLTNGIYEPREIALDATNVYWAAYERGVGKVPKAGGALADLSSIPAGCWSVAVSSQTGRLYWSDVYANKLRSIATSGGTAGDHATNVDSYGIAVDSTYVYFTTATEVIKFPTSGGTNVPVATGQAGPHGIAVDASGTYWTNNVAAGTVMRYSPGKGLETLASGQGNPTGIALDASSVYWTNNGSGQIMKVAK